MGASDHPVPPNITLTLLPTYLAPLAPLFIPSVGTISSLAWVPPASGLPFEGSPQVWLVVCLQAGPHFPPLFCAQESMPQKRGQGPAQSPSDTPLLWAPAWHLEMGKRPSGEGRCPWRPGGWQGRVWARGPVPSRPRGASQPCSTEGGARGVSALSEGANISLSQNEVNGTIKGGSL